MLPDPAAHSPDWSLSLSLSKVTLENKMLPDPAAHSPDWSLSLSLSLTDAVHPEGSPGSFWGWTPVVLFLCTNIQINNFFLNHLRIKLQIPCIFTYNYCVFFQNKNIHLTIQCNTKLR